MRNSKMRLNELRDNPNASADDLARESRRWQDENLPDLLKV